MTNKGSVYIVLTAVAGAVVRAAVVCGGDDLEVAGVVSGASVVLVCVWSFTKLLACSQFYLFMQFMSPSSALL